MTQEGYTPEKWLFIIVCGFFIGFFFPFRYAGVSPAFWSLVYLMLVLTAAINLMSWPYLKSVMKNVFFIAVSSALGMAAQYASRLPTAWLNWSILWGALVYVAIAQAIALALLLTGNRECRETRRKDGWPFYLIMTTLFWPRLFFDKNTRLLEKISAAVIVFLGALVANRLPHDPTGPIAYVVLLIAVSILTFITEEVDDEHERWRQRPATTGNER
ncbi:MAG: hypothetical protein HYT39_04025 [Candidatus Sungbacteria bacterium]|nr:hypothetical protein [Candidatus Sungbacteria bacterium]